jgi:NAD(P)-dependent dehydrogenase (short-subunit alcohol dehydrogenase family)
MVTARGGRGIHVQADHTVESEVRALFDRVEAESGQLDILVNDIWGGDALTEFGVPFWELALDKGLTMLERAIHTHIITSRHGVPLMLKTGRGCIFEITDGDTYGYRGNLFYDLVKTSVIRLAFSMAWELRRTEIAAVAVTPGFLRSEEMLERFGVTEANWRDGAKTDPNFIASETPYYVGRAIASLAADPKIKDKSGRVFSSWGLAREYGFRDVDGSQPDWGAHFEQAYGQPLKTCDDDFYGYWQDGPMEIVFPDWPKTG